MVASLFLVRSAHGCSRASFSVSTQLTVRVESVESRWHIMGPLLIPSMVLACLALTLFVLLLIIVWQVRIPRHKTQILFSACQVPRPEVANSPLHSLHLVCVCVALHGDQLHVRRSVLCGLAHLATVAFQAARTRFCVIS